jgi:hypothetical protein
MTTGNGETDELREQIRDTRSRMSDTLDQLGERLNPETVKEQVKDSIRQATVGKVSDIARQAKEQVIKMERSLVRTARDNPVPTAMIGIGLAWIILNARRRGPETNGHSVSGDEGTGYVGELGEGESEGAAARLKHGLEKVRDQAAELGGTIKEKVSEVGERTSALASKVGEQTGALASRVGERTAAMASRARESTRRVASSVAEGTKRQAQRVENQYNQTPLVFGLVALAAGLAIGLSLPSTETESRLLGDVSEKATDKAREAVRETTDKVSRVAERVVDEGKRTAGQALREEGLIAPVG